MQKSNIIKRRISAHIRWMRFIFAPLGAYFIYLFFKHLIESHIDSEAFISSFIFSLISIGLYYFFNTAKTVEFDENHMYVRDKEKKEEKIPLNRIYKIKLTMIEINNKSLWKIYYYNENQVETSVKILPRWMNLNFNKFKDAVKTANKDAEIRNWSHSFDFD